MLGENGSARGESLLDWNESPLGPPEAAVRRVIAAAQSLHRYPRGLMEEVTALAADYLRVAPGQVLLCAGVDEAVDITLSLADRGWGVHPGFDGYQDRVTANGKPFHAVPLDADWQPAAGWDGLTNRDIVFLAQPNNPTGNLFDPGWIRSVRRAAGYLFIDETYQDFSARPSVLGGGVLDDGVADEGAQDGPGIFDPGYGGQLLVYRSFSKAMGLAGIRLGALVADAELIARLEPVRRFMPIDAVSLNAAAGVLEEPSFVKTLTDHVLKARPGLTATLRESGLFDEVRDTHTNFVVAHLREEVAASVLEALAEDGVRVKPCDGLGLPRWLRISVGSWDDQQRLADCLTRVAGTADTAAVPTTPTTV